MYHFYGGSALKLSEGEAGWILPPSHHQTHSGDPRLIPRTFMYYASDINWHTERGNAAKSELYDPEQCRGGESTKAGAETQRDQASYYPPFEIKPKRWPRGAGAGETGDGF